MGREWQLQYTEEEIATGMDFINKLEDGHVIPTLATINGDMADSLDKNAKWIDGKVRRYLRVGFFCIQVPEGSC